MDQIDLQKHILFYSSLLRKLPQLTHSVYITSVFFIVSALDLLGQTDKIDGEALKNWIYSQEVINPSCPSVGGFRANPSTSGLESSKWDYGTLASSYSALAILLILKDDLSRVDKASLLKAMSSLQKEDGSFSSHSDGIERDMRFIYCVCAICTMLNSWEGINQETLLSFILRSQSYEGSIAMTPGQEGHGGSTYCALSSLFMMGKLHELPHKDLLIEWLLNRQGMGFQGRVGKMPDSCYGYWVGISLEVLEALDFVNRDENIEFYLDCQSQVGGFSKYPDHSPDLVHSYLGLVAVSILGHPGLKEVYGPLGISLEAAQQLQHLRRISKLRI